MRRIIRSPYGYGVSDLNYYGAYSNVPGYGMMWQPYFAGVGWDPFMDGAWSWYPGYGYMFASAYPWGWMPYRYGNWTFVPGIGWMWQPGGLNYLGNGASYMPATCRWASSAGRAIRWNVEDGGGGEGWGGVNAGALSAVVTPARQAWGSARLARQSRPLEPSGCEDRICRSASCAAIRLQLEPEHKLQQLAELVNVNVIVSSVHLPRRWHFARLRARTTDS